MRQSSRRRQADHFFHHSVAQRVQFPVPLDVFDGNGVAQERPLEVGLYSLQPETLWRYRARLRHIRAKAVLLDVLVEGLAEEGGQPLVEVDF
jgi:hypothetical protein